MPSAVFDYLRVIVMVLTLIFISLVFISILLYNLPKDLQKDKNVNTQDR